MSRLNVLCNLLLTESLIINEQDDELIGVIGCPLLKQATGKDGRCQRSWNSRRPPWRFLHTIALILR